MQQLAQKLGAEAMAIRRAQEPVLRGLGETERWDDNMVASTRRSFRY